MPLQKFKTKKVYNNPGDSHFLTFSTKDKKPYLADERICRLLAGSISDAVRRHQYAVLAYAFMPDHVHLLVHPLQEPYDISSLMKSIKQSSTRKAKREGWIEDVVWEAGGGYDRNINTPDAHAKVIEYIHMNPVLKDLAELTPDYPWSSANWRATGKQGAIHCRHLNTLFD